MATWNVARFFDTTCDSGRCGADAFEEIPSAAQFRVKVATVADAVASLNADIVLLQEVESAACLDALVEASGNDPFIVMPSASVEVVARGAAFAAFLNCGQVCTSAERFYVHTDVYADFVEAFAEQARTLRVGSGLDTVDMGPLAAARERDLVERIVARAVDQGARVVTGARRPAHLPVGWFYEPTVLEVAADSEIMHGESFGPIAPVCRVASLDEAIARANDSELGLGANIYTSDLHEAFRAVHEIESGIVWVNTPLNDNDAVPFGGRKLTGSGRELGAEGLEQFRRSKMVMISPTAEADPEWFPYPDDDSFGAQA